MLLICDVLVALSLAPFFIITAFSKALGDTSFNTWIPEPSVDGLFMVLSWSLGTSSAAFVLLVLVLCIPKLVFDRVRYCDDYKRDNAFWC